MGSEKGKSNEGLERFMIKKGRIDRGIWERILAQSKGTDLERISAGKLIFQNYRSVPSEADSVLKGLVANSQEENVRKAIALELVREAHIPSGLYIDLLNILMQDPSLEVKKIIEAQFKLIVEPLAEIGKIVAGYQTNVIRIANSLAQYQKMINESVIKFSEAFSKLTEFLNSPEFGDFEYNWLIFLPIDDMCQLFEMHKKGKDAEIKKIFLRANKDEKYLDEFIERIGCSDLFKSRASIIKDAVEAHVTGKYSLSIPVFLTQIEGLLWDFAEQKGIATGTEITKSNGSKIQAHSAKSLLRDTNLRDAISEHVSNYFLARVYTEDFRHGVLHGRNINYDKEEDSMRLMLFVRVLLETCK